jgi:hypothetical protein
MCAVFENDEIEPKRAGVMCETAEKLEVILRASLPRLRACWHFTNLRPMWSADNMRKPDKIEHSNAQLVTYLLTKVLSEYFLPCRKSRTAPFS